MEKNIFIFTSETGEYAKKIFSFEKNDNILSNLYLPKGKITSFLRRVYLSPKLNNLIDLPFKNFYFKYCLKKLKIKMNSNKISYFIIFDNNFLGRNILFLKFLKTLYPNSKIIYWNWNKIDEGLYEKYKAEYEKIADRIVTYDFQDAKKYGYEFYPQIFSKEIAKKIGNDEKTDLFFIGNDKGRARIINKFLEKIKNVNQEMRLDINILKDNKNCNYKEFEHLENCYLNKFLTYSEVLKKTSETKIILDIVQEDQTGLTLRVMESLFFKKKLITNNMAVKTYDFYNSKNIMVIEKLENLEYINEFLNSEYEKIDDNILDRYTVEQWLNFMTK